MDKEKNYCLLAIGYCLLQLGNWVIGYWVIGILPQPEPFWLSASGRQDY
jgi:hypothetical protein